MIFQPTNSTKEQYYKSVKKNVDTLKLIQFGVTLCDENGNYPQETATWQFNLKFDVNSDQYSNESIALLSNSGINFELISQKGIPFDIFGEYLMTSGLMLNEDIHWVSFHGVYDFAYLLKMITNLPLPESENLFFEALRLYFPHFYDIRYLVRFTDNFRGSLSRLGHELNIGRIGIQHQAGSDSIITSEIFFKLKSEIYSEDLIKADKNVLFGMGIGNEDNEFVYNAGGYLNYPINLNKQVYLPTNGNKVNPNQIPANTATFEYPNTYFDPQVNASMNYNYLRNLNNTGYFPPNYQYNYQNIPGTYTYNPPNLNTNNPNHVEVKKNHK